MNTKTIANVIRSTWNHRHIFFHLLTWRGRGKVAVLHPATRGPSRCLGSCDVSHLLSIRPSNRPPCVSSHGLWRRHRLIAGTWSVKLVISLLLATCVLVVVVLSQQQHCCSSYSEKFFRCVLSWFTLWLLVKHVARVCLVDHVMNPDQS